MLPDVAGVAGQRKIQQVHEQAIQDEIGEDDEEPPAAGSPGQRPHPGGEAGKQEQRGNRQAQELRDDPQDVPAAVILDRLLGRLGHRHGTGRLGLVPDAGGRRRPFSAGRSAAGAGRAMRHVRAARSTGRNRIVAPRLVAYPAHSVCRPQRHTECAGYNWPIPAYYHGNAGNTMFPGVGDSSTGHEWPLTSMAFSGKVASNLKRKERPAPVGKGFSCMHIYLGLFVVSFSALSLEVALVRLLSVTSWYYLSFFAISTAMLGSTAGATRVYLRPGEFARGNLEKVLSAYCVYLALSIPVTLVMLCLIPLALNESIMGLLARAGHDGRLRAAVLLRRRDRFRRLDQVRPADWQALRERPARRLRWVVCSSWGALRSWTCLA